MKNKIISSSIVFGILILVLISLTACSDKNVEDNNSINSNVVYSEKDFISMQSNVEGAISELQISFMTQELSTNPDATFYEYITLENLNEVLEEYGYSVCLSNNLSKVPNNMKLHISEDNTVYFTDGNHILKVVLSETADKDQFEVITGNVEMVK
jgi:hypothetical protein